MQLAEFSIFLLLIALICVQGQRYQLPQPWQVTNNEQLREFNSSSYNASYRLLQAGERPLVSRSGRFGLSFFRFNDSAEYYFALVLGISNETNSSSAAACVWTANRDNPVTESATLAVTDQGVLQLSESNGTVVWSSPPGVSDLEIQDRGSFVLYNTSGGVLWQSFDHPTDILLEGQVLVTGQKLSSSSSSSNLATGRMTMEVQPSGLIFFLNFEIRQPYMVWNMYNGNMPADETSINVPCPGYRAALTYSTGRLTMNFEATGNTSSQPCSPITSAVLGNFSSGDLHYLRLGNDGNLVPYTYNARLAAWEAGLPFRRSRLGDCLPMTCGSNQICSGNGQCSCVVERGNNESAATCSSPSTVPLVCNHEFEAQNHHFFNVSGAGYFSNNYTKADRVSTLKDCWDLCLSNCSCTALFYNRKAGTCFFVDRIYGGLTRDPDFDGFLKLQNARPFRPKDPTLLLATSISGSVFFLSAIGLAGLLIWKHRLDKVARVLAVALQGSARKYNFRELEAATANFSTSLGRGAFGTVFAGTLADGRMVAVKRLEKFSGSDRGFLAEMASLGRISHSNIIQLYGFCSEAKQLMLVYEFAANGSLDKWLFDDRCLDWNVRYRISLGLARGLAYLHEESRQLIIHLDIKPENILLDETFCPKLADFGLAKLVKNRDVSSVTTVRGTPGYLAPEWLFDFTATTKCDVYSFGMVLLELIGGRRNFSKLGSAATGDDALWWYFPAWAVSRVARGDVGEVVDSRIRHSVDEAEVKKVLYVALWCIQDNPVERPSMDAVVRMLEGRREVLDPPLYFRFVFNCPGRLRFSSSVSNVADGDGVSVTMVPDDLSGPR